MIWIALTSSSREANKENSQVRGPKRSEGEGGRRTHSKITRREESGDLRLMRKQSLKEVDRPVEPERVSKVLEEPSGEMIRDDGGDLDLWIRTELPSCSRQGGKGERSASFAFLLPDKRRGDSPLKNRLSAA